MDSIVSDTFFLESLLDPVAVSTFVNSTDYDVAKDKEIGESLTADMDDIVDTIFDDEILDDTVYGTSTDTIDRDIDEELEVDCDYTDEDGELIDMVDGLI